MSWPETVAGTAALLRQPAGFCGCIESWTEPEQLDIVARRYGS
jgi:hypothetical protein